ncbi:MAG TPA: MauE/DoxX family redox-associated membrane protein [Steroidobacteraceae bacterium]|jgi:uncharacterized membrane protein|nr:MauE/DoxX family redox-associated membrane protein [Steroidobacteraceae bacterium]
MTLDPAIGTLVIACIAFLFASAGLHKLRDLGQFEQSFAAYDLAPWLVRLRATWILPVAEIAVAAGLVIGAARTAAVGAAILLLSIYATAIAVNLARGRRDLACGCGGPNDRRPIAAWMVWRNALIAVAAGTGLLPWSARPLGITDAITVAFGVLTVALVYLCIDQLFGNAGRAAAGGAR